MTELRFIGDWSLYLGVPAALLAGVAVWLLYRRELRARGGWLSYLLPGLRAAAAVLLVLMLTGPVLHHRKVVGQLARILVLVDGSESMSVRDEQMTPERKLLCAVQMGFLSETLLPEDLWGALKGLGRAQRRDVGEGAGEGADQEKGYHQAAALLRDDLETTYQHLQQIEFDYSLLTITPKGTILYEYWEGINGSKISDFTRSRKYREAPSGTRALTQFEGPHDWKDNYGSRISGFLYPPETGEYTFWITSDDEGELYLSDNDNPSGKKRIGWVRDHAPQESWEQSGEQKSQPIRLEGGRRYYIEAISKEGGGQDHLRVGWRRPDGTMQRPIPGEYLSAYPRGQSDQFYMASQESILREFRLQLLEPAKDLERKQVTKDTKSYIQNYTTLTRKAGDWQGQLRQYFERWAGRLSQSGRPEVREAVNRFEQLNRWQRTEGLLLGGEAPLLSELIEHHDVELFTFTEKSLQPNWRGQAGEGSLSEALPEVMAGEPTASATNLSLGLRAAVHQRRAEEAATERAADPEEAGATRLAVVLFTDGRHNYGESPIQPAKLCGSREIPIFTVGMGAVKEPEDLAVVRVEHPRSLFHQDRVKGRIVLKDEMPAGKAFSLRIVCGGKLLWSRELKTTGAKQRTIDYDFPLEQFLKEELKKQPRQLSFRSFPLEMRAAVSGAGAADRQPENNARSFRLRAIFQKNRILILDGRPRWEYRYLRNLFERDEKWEVTALVFDPSAAGGGIQRGDKGHQFPNQRELLYGYDLILLGDFPETALQPTEWGWIRDSVGKRGAGLIFIDGRREHLRKYEKSPLAELLPVVWSRSGEHKDAISLRLTKQGRLRLTEQGEHLAALTLSTEDISNSQVWSNLKAPHWLAGIRPLPGAEVLVEAVVGPKEPDGRPSGFLAGPA